MGNYLETFRSTVAAWECDHVEHFTTAYYFDKLASATVRMLQELGYTAGDPQAPVTQECFVNFSAELRSGDVFHIETGVLSASPETLVLGHKVLNSASGALCTSVVQTLSGSARAETARFAIEWDGPRAEPRPDVPETARWLPTAACVVRAQDLDWSGRLGLSAYIHHASAANVQCQSRIGMTPAYSRENRIGFSTFEYQYRLLGELPREGDALQTDSAVTHVGRTSLRFVHRTRNAATGATLALLGQVGVHLDLDARRPAPLPPALVAAGRELMAG